MIRSVCVIALVVGLPLATAESSAAQTVEVDPKSVLRSICGAGLTEPACEALSDLSPDEAWVVARFACRSSQRVNTPACVAMRSANGGVLSFNLRTNMWSAFWEGASHPLKFDVTGAPTLRLKPRQAKPLKILIEEISPLTYSAIAGIPKEEDVAVVAGLKSILALAGTGIQGLVQTLTFSAIAETTTTESSRTPFRPFNERPSRDAPPPPPPPPACLVEGPSVLAIADQVTRRQGQLVTVGTAMDGLSASLEDLDGARQAFLQAAQKAEDGKSVGAKELVLPDVLQLESAYQALDAARRRLEGSTRQLAACQPLLTSYASLLGAPVDGRIVREFATRIDGIGGCTDVEVSALGASIKSNAAKLAVPIVGNVAVCTPTLLKPILETHRDAMKPLVERLLNARQVEEKVWAALDKAETARKEVMSGADVLSRQVNRGRRHTWNGSLIRELAVTRPNPELTWNKVQSHEIVMKVDSPYVKELTLAHGAEEKRAYKLESATGQLLGYGVGLIYTPLQESTYTAVTAPGGSDKVITETKRETRAGDLAAFLAYRFMEHSLAKRALQPSLEFGVGLTSDRPAFFLGGALEILRAGRFGVGWAPQRISVLADGQTPNVTVVSSTDDIKTVKRFDVSNWYASFTFALDSLSLFNGK